MSFQLHTELVGILYPFSSGVRVRLCLLVWNWDGLLKRWGHNKRSNRKAVEPVTHLAELVRQLTVKCFQFNTHTFIILQNESTVV